MRIRWLLRVLGELSRSAGDSWLSAKCILSTSNISIVMFMELSLGLTHIPCVQLNTFVKAQSTFAPLSFPALEVLVEVEEYYNHGDGVRHVSREPNTHHLF